MPGTVQLGLMIDNLDGGGFNPSSLKVVQAGGPGASAVVDTTGASYNDRIPDWLFFDIQAQPGEPGDLRRDCLRRPNGCACRGCIV